jgi:hypothetical protein
MSNRFVLPPEARNIGIFGGLILMALGLLVGWVQSETQTPLPPTGSAPSPAPDSRTDTVVKALVNWLSNKRAA